MRYEGLDWAIARHRADGLPEERFKERYTRNAKALADKQAEEASARTEEMISKAKQAKEPGVPETEAEIRSFIAQYYAMISNVDRARLHPRRARCLDGLCRSG